MAITLRPYQQSLYDQTHAAWQQGKKYVMNVLSTGGGKTPLLAVMNSDGVPSITIVHRAELLSQISTTYAQAGVLHNILAPQAVINLCIRQQIKKVGRSFYDPKAPAVIGGVDTIIRRFEPGDRWCNQVRRWSQDECHHALGLSLDRDQANKWGKCMQLFPNALGFGVTATPIRADGRSLHVDQGGAFDHMVQGISMSELIEMGNLCPYRVVAPQSSIDEAQLKIGSTGDFTDKSVRDAAHKSKIVGNVVEIYQQKTPGKQAIVFAVDVLQSQEMAEEFRAAGVSAKSLDGKTPDAERSDAVEAFERGDLKVLCNVGLFDEGFDVPAVEVTIMARPTQSYGLFAQQIGRCLRPAPGKTHGIVIDMVDNVIRMSGTHGLPDTPRKWHLWKDQQTKVPRNPDAIPMRSCDNCTLAFERVQTVCPYCGHEHVPQDRGAPEAVDGMLAEMSPELLHRLRMAKAEILAEPRIPFGASDAIVGAKHKQHAQRIMAHNSLSEAMSFWGGVRLANGDSDAQMQAKFYFRFGVDVMTAGSLKTADAIKLAEEVRKSLT